MLEKAIHIATKAHEGQLDRAGKPYVLHPLRVMESCENETEKICAVLHDVIEDTDITIEDLEAEGFSGEVLEVLDLLSKRPGESYEGFIERICANETACLVKIADLKDNMDLGRLRAPTAEDYKRREKYLKALEMIRSSLGHYE